MDSGNHTDGALSSGHHVVEWQLDVTPSQARPHDHDVQGRIQVLQAQAMALLHTVVTNRGTAATRQALSALDAEIASLRAQLAWRRAEAHNNDRLTPARAADA